MSLKSDQLEILFSVYRLGIDTIIHPPVEIITGVVDQRWIGTWEAGQGV